MKTGQELINSALTHVGERYVWGAIVPKNNPNLKGLGIVQNLHLG